MRTSAFGPRAIETTAASRPISAAGPPRPRDRWRAGRARIALPRRMDLPGHGTQRVFHRRPVRFLIGRKPEALLDAGDLRIAEQRVGFCAGGLAASFGLVALQAPAPLSSAPRSRPGRSRKRLAQRLARNSAGLGRFGRGRRDRCHRQPVALALPVRNHGSDSAGGRRYRLASRRHAVAAKNARRSRADKRKSVRATIVIAFVKQFSVSGDDPRSLSRQL